LAFIFAAFFWSITMATPRSTLLESTIKSLPLLGRGKVRDNYAVGDDKLLIVTTDRLSAFDVIMGEPIPNKGRVLNQMADFWFGKLSHIVPNHNTGIDPATVVAPDEVEQVQGRAVVVKRLEPILVEAVVRGYLAGSGWKDSARADLHARREGRNGPSRRKHHLR
jgi:phosphoribosylaminoimidazole-succinocarboxamide synthase